jgi:hypothetical protein
LRRNGPHNDPHNGPHGFDAWGPLVISGVANIALSRTTTTACAWFGRDGEETLRPN